jgi:hypothetical protein
MSINKPTQVRHPNRAAIRTFVQGLIAFAAILPLIITTVGLSPAIPWVGAVIAVTTAITRVMAIPAVNSFIEQHLKFLAAKPVNESTVIEGGY